MECANATWNVLMLNGMCYCYTECANAIWNVLMLHRMRTGKSIFSVGVGLVGGRCRFSGRSVV